MPVWFGFYSVQKYEFRFEYSSIDHIVDGFVLSLVKFRVICDGSVQFKSLRLS